MVEEAKAVEEALDREIKQLQQGLDPENLKENKELENFCALAWESEVTPADTNFTISALLGRLRDDLALPLPPNSTIPAHREKIGLLYQPPKKKKKTDAGGDLDSKQSSLEKQKQILALQDNPEYSKEHPNTTHLLAVLKKISTHRAAIVFRRPVNPKEAPGYTDRILFPMDLSMVRKMITARMIKSYSELHQRIGLICHNCIKYNGRESDYGVVTREFEAMVDDYILGAVETAAAVAKAAQAAAAVAPPAAPATTAPAVAGSAPSPAAAAVKKEKAPSRGTSPKPPPRSSSPKPPSRSSSPKPPPSTTTTTTTTSPKPPARSTSPKPPSQSNSPKPPSRSTSPTPPSMVAPKPATNGSAAVPKAPTNGAVKPATVPAAQAPTEAPTTTNGTDAAKSEAKEAPTEATTKEDGK